MNDMPLISVIVPVYNVEDYLEECVDSLIGQTYFNQEIILIDDGSTDRSSEICDEYAIKDERVKTIHQTNRGLSGARNVGLSVAKGDYIAFVDSDDFVAPFFLEELYGAMLEANVDIVACLYSNDISKIVGKTRYKKNVIFMNSEQMLKCWHGKHKRFETVVWNKLYKRDIFEKGEELRFWDGRRHEDVLISHLLVEKAERIALIYNELYFYRERKGSIKNSLISDEYIQANLNAQMERLLYFKGKKYWKSYFNLLKGYWEHKAMFILKRLI